MRAKLLFVAGAAVGYVLGARAGRKRYEQIKAAAARVWEMPSVQNQVNAVEDYAAEKFGELPGALFGGAKKVVTQVVNRAQAAQKQSPTYRVPPPSRAAATSSVTIAAPPDDETASAATTAPGTAASTASGAPVKAAKPAKSPKRTAGASNQEIDEADDAGA